MNTINIYQQEWAFTSKDSEKPIIKTGSFGSCYVITFTSEKFAAMTHIDDLTDVSTIRSIFNKFLENSVELKNVKVIILGGWKDHSESFKWGCQVVNKIEEAGFKNVSTKNMHIKRSLTNLEYTQKKSDRVSHYHFGAQVDAVSGNTFILNKENFELDNEQRRRSELLFKTYGNTDLEFPINQVF